MDVRLTIQGFAEYKKNTIGHSSTFRGPKGVDDVCLKMITFGLSARIITQQVSSVVGLGFPLEPGKIE